jgi:hypothetical protein
MPRFSRRSLILFTLGVLAFALVLSRSQRVAADNDKSPTQTTFQYETVSATVCTGLQFPPLSPLDLCPLGKFAPSVTGLSSPFVRDVLNSLGAQGFDLVEVTPYTSYSSGVNGSITDSNVVFTLRKPTP